MARPKTVSPEDARREALETALATIERRYGLGSVMRLSDTSHQVVPVIPTGSIGLDLALGVGGIPRGRVTEIFGPESSGKTTQALHIIAEAQKRGGKDYKQAMLLDVERGRRTEIEDTAGYIWHLAQQNGIEIPYLDFGYRVVRAFDERLQ